MRFWKQLVRFLRYDSRIYLGALLGLWVLSSSVCLADVVHFHDGKNMRGKLNSVTGELIEFKPSFSRAQNFQRLTLSNRHDVVEMRNLEKIFGEIMYADGFSVEVATVSGHVRLNRLLIKNIVLGAPEQPPVEIPAQPATSPQSMFPGGAVNSVGANAVQTRIPLQNEQPTFLFPPLSTPSEDRDAINTDDRTP